MKKPWLQHYDKGVPHSIDYPDVSLPEFLIQTAEDHPDDIATTLYDMDITYREINEKVNGFAHTLVKMGVRKGDRVALILPNSPTYVIAAYGSMKIGAITANINVTTGGDELLELLKNSGAVVAVTLDLFVQNLIHVVKKTPVRHIIIHSVMGAEKKIDREAGLPELLIFNDLVAAESKDEPTLACTGEDVAVLQYTSGSTGIPKAAMLRHKSIVANVLQLSRWEPLTYPPNSPVICIIPFFHVFGMTVCLHLSIYEGYRMILIPMFDWTNILDMVELIKKYRPVSFPAVPALWASLVSYPKITKDSLSSINIASGGGSPLPIWVLEKYESITGRKIAEAYGLSEVSASTHINPFHGPTVPGSIGIPLPDTEAKIMDLVSGENECPDGEVGELIVKGPQLMQGYWNNPELTRQALRDGWLYTGDLAYMNADGYFFIADRKDDLIISRGFNVYPSEVEKVLVRYEGVKDAAVVGLPDRKGGESISAFIVPEEDVEIDQGGLVEYCQERLAAHKVPKMIRLIDAIPRNPAGKVLKRLLREELAKR